MNFARVGTDGDGSSTSSEMLVKLRLAENTISGGIKKDTTTQAIIALEGVEKRSNQNQGKRSSYYLRVIPCSLKKNCILGGKRQSINSILQTLHTVRCGYFNQVENTLLPESSGSLLNFAAVIAY